MRFAKIILPFILLLFSISMVKATNRYVSALLGSDSYTGTYAQPYLTIQKAANLTNPGDTVFIMNGTYSTVISNNYIVNITRSGTANNPIVYINYEGHKPLIDFNTWNGILITNGASYIVVDGITIRGNNRNITLSQALNQPSSCANPSGTVSPIYNGNGLSVGGKGIGLCHHIVLRNLEIYECGGSGLNAIESDYITIENNKIYNNCWYCKYAGSGISVFHSWNSDNDTVSYKINIRKNILYGNRLFVPWKNGAVCQGITDGNGIIFDDNRNTQSSSSLVGTPYKGKALIENNLSYKNGGRGIHSYYSDNATIRDNTTFQNCMSDEISEGEITVVNGTNASVYNNIMYARTGKKVNTASNVTNFKEDFNIIYNSSGFDYLNTNDIMANPLFVDTANADFRLLPNSPAINAGGNASLSNTTDFLGVNRPQGYNFDIGAYEFTGTQATALTFGAGNIVASIVGDGSTTLDTRATAVNLLEYTSSGAATGNAIVLGNTASNASNRMLLSGDNSTGDGQLSLSGDGRYLAIAGYNGAVGDSATIFQANEKIVTRITYDGTVDYTTRLPSSTMNKTIRSAITLNGSMFYITGSNSSPATSNSTRFLNFGTPITTASIAFTSSVRSLKMFGSVVYYANNNIVGYLTPNPSNGNYAITTSLPGVSLSGYNFQSFVLLSLSPSASYNGTGYDLLYCADQSLGLVKFYWNGTTWVLAGTYNPTSPTGITGGLQDITARINAAGKPEIFVVKGAASNNNIMMLTDANTLSGSIATNHPTINFSIAAGTNYMFRGVSFVPTFKQTNVSWIGNTNTDWNNASNWSFNQVPDSLVSVNIPISCNRYPVIDVNNTNNSINNLTIQDNYLVNNGGLSIKSTLSNDGLISGIGTVNLNGASLQNISGNGTVSNLTLNNTSGAKIDSLGQLTITGVLKLKLGQLATNGNLIFNSDSTGNGILSYYGINGNVGTLNGNVSVQRYIPAKTSRKYVFISSPISQTIKNAWQQQVYITGTGNGGMVCGSTTGDGILNTDKYNTNGFDVSPINTPSLFTYTANPINGSRWVSVANTNNTNLLSGIGYRINIRGNRNSNTVSCNNQLNSFLPTPPAAVTLLTSGTMTTGDKVVTLNDLLVHKYTLLGNPYQSPISFSSFQTANSSKINNKFWTYSPYSQTSGNYTTYLNGVCANQAQGYDGSNGDFIAVGQAFFVESNSQGSVTFRENDKIGANPPNTQYFGTSTQKTLRIALHATNSDTRFDEVVVQYSNNGTKKYNAKTDAISFNNGNQFLYFLKDNNRLAIATMPEVNSLSDTLQLGIESSTIGNFRLSFSVFNFKSKSISLKDNFSGNLLDISSNAEYNFSVTSDTLSKGNNRFQIILIKPTTLAIQDIILSANKVKDCVYLAWNNISNTSSYFEVQKSTDGLTFQNIGKVEIKNESHLNFAYIDSNSVSSAYYRIKQVGLNGNDLFSNMVSVNSRGNKNEIKLYPSPLVSNKLNVSFSNISEGKYLLILTNMIGQRIKQEQIFHTGGIGNYSLDFGFELMNGQYTVSVYKEMDDSLVFNSMVTIQR